MGDRYDAKLHANQTLIERFDGSGWSVIHSPNQNNHNNGLNGVSMVAGGGWAVGYALAGPHGGSSGPYHPLALRYNGGTWSLASPANITGDAVFTDVDTLTQRSAWAVGRSQAKTGATEHTLIEHASGGAWTPVASPNDGTNTSDNALMAIGGTSATGLWAVGYRQSPTGFKPLILRYNTALPSPSWVSVSGAGGVPSPGKIDTVLTGVDARTASDVWAVGYYESGGGERPLALHWNGRRWRISQIPGIGMLRHVKATASGNVWSTGTYYSTSEHRTKTLVVHFNGKTWTTARSADAALPTADQLIGLATNQAGSMIIAVGGQGSKPLFERASCPTGPVSLPTRPAPPSPPAPVAPGVGPAPSPPPPTPPPTVPVPVTVTDRATAAGIAENGLLHTWSAAAADFNGDKWPDLYIGHHGGLSHLYFNNHDGTFSEVDKGFFKGGDRHDCVAADFNTDGREDLFCSAGANRGTALKSNGLYIQQPDHTFVDKAYQWHVPDPLGRGRHSTVLDVNNDGYPDLFSGTELLRPDGLPDPNRLYLNTGHGSMIDSPAMGLDLNAGSKCAHTVDYNNDGWPDLLICGGSDTTTLSLHLYKNNQGHGFKDVSSILGPPVPANDAVLADINHDNLPDLITLTWGAVAKRLQRANGTFGPSRTIHKVRGGRSLAVGDINADHNPDIYVVDGKAGTTSNEPDYLLLGDPSGHFTTHPIPETSTGQGNRVYSLDYNRDGLTDFLVLNGQDKYLGPIQLLTPHITRMRSTRQR